MHHLSLYAVTIACKLAIMAPTAKFTQPFPTTKHTDAQHGSQALASWAQLVIVYTVQVSVGMPSRYQWSALVAMFATFVPQLTRLG